jgi:hypothetical protein
LLEVQELVRITKRFVHVMGRPYGNPVITILLPVRFDIQVFKYTPHKYLCVCFTLFTVYEHRPLLCNRFGYGIR